MKTAALCIAVSLAGGSAFAAEKVPAPAPQCISLNTLKADLKGAKFTPLNISQFHFAEGVFVATPPASPPPYADNAMLVQIKGKKNSIIVWMKAECASTTPPTTVGPGLVAILNAIKPVAGENSDADDTSQDMNL